VNVHRTVVVLSIVLAAAGLLEAADPQPAPPLSVPTLEQQLDELDRVDADLAAAEQELTTGPAPERRRELQARIIALRADQERLVNAIEAIVGPLPPRVAAGEPAAEAQAEAQLERQQRRHDALLERDVERRLSTP
jgi:hypothetical protein